MALHLDPKTLVAKARLECKKDSKKFGDLPCLADIKLGRVLFYLRNGAKQYEKFCLSESTGSGVKLLPKE